MSITKSKPGRKKTLSIEKILSTSLNIANSQGLEQLSIRRLAEQLNVTPMAIYRHVENKDELLQRLLDSVIAMAEIQPPAEDEHWRDWTVNNFVEMHRLLLENPGVIPLLGTTSVFSQGAIETTNTMLGALVQAGFKPEQSVQCFMTLINHMVGHAAKTLNAINTMGISADELPEKLPSIAGAIGSLSKDKYPYVVQLAPNLANSFSSPDYIEGLNHIVNCYSID